MAPTTARLGLGVIVATAVASAAAVAVHAGEPVYAIPGWGIALSVALAVATVAGALLAARSGSPGYAIALTPAFALASFGVLAIFSVGLLALGLAAYVAVRAQARQHASAPRPPRAVAGACLAGAPLPLLILLALSGPVVSCSENSTGSGENIFMSLAAIRQAESVGESESSAGPGSNSGFAEGPGYAYSFECQGDEVTAFQIAWR